MNKTLSIALSLAVTSVGLAAATAPSQAASRFMSSSLAAFEYRCERHGGVFGLDGAVANCQTPTVPVSCEFVEAERAICAWPGIPNQVAVTRVIGVLPPGYAANFSSSEDSSVANGMGGGGGGGFQGPDDFQIAPDNDPKPNFDGPKDFQMAP